MKRPTLITHNGFSLVELSIVLVILGLLVGGILSGRSLIRASELRAIVTERDKFTAAIFTFRDKYFALPGDMPNAYQFWGTACGTNTTTPSTGCNGNGDGLIVIGDEDFKAWKHMASAGLIEGTYTGIVSADGGVSVTNSPRSKMNQGYWDMTSIYLMVSGYDIAGSNVSDGMLFLHWGAISSGTSNLIDHPSLTRAEAWSIDKKIDDGRANTGILRGNSTLSCFDNGTDYYDLAGTMDGNADSNDCVLHFLVK